MPASQRSTIARGGTSLCRTTFPLRISLPSTRGANVLQLRNGTWKFRPGDDPTWSRHSLNDTSWTLVQAPADWATYGVATSIAWYRRHFVSTREQLEVDATGGLRLALGPIADADEAYVNGVRIGRTGIFPEDEPTLQPWEPRIRPRGAGACADALQYRTYSLPAHSLRGGDEVVAVRVFADRGAAQMRGATTYSSSKRRQPRGGGAEDGWPSGLVDPNGGGDFRAGAFDPAVSTGQLTTGFTTDGVGWYRTRLPLSDGEIARVAEGEAHVILFFDGAYGSTRVWVNGLALEGGSPHPLASFAPFQYDVSASHLRVAFPPQLTVRVDGRGDSSRWYTGNGLM